MTPEQVRDYLVAHQIDEDTAQEVALDYWLWKREPIRSPKSWAFKRALWRRIDAQRKAGPLAVGTLDNGSLGSSPALQLRLAEARQELERYAQSRTGKGKKLMRWHSYPSKPWLRLPDYLALKRERP